MWPFSKAKRPAVDESAGPATTFLLDSLERTSTAVLNTAAGRNWRETQLDAFPIVAREVLLFELHLASRLAMKARGKNSEAQLMEAMVDSMAKRAPEVMRPRFQDEYAVRQLFYTKFATLKPEDDQSYEGTLFWEFSKLILKVTDQKPEACKMQGLNVICDDMLHRIDEGFEQLGVYE
jgi:hypothetical protein